MTNQDQQTIIFPSDKEAARFVTDIKGWVSRNGLFFGDNKCSEQAARYDGSTHSQCESCGEPSRKAHFFCDACSLKRDIEKYGRLERVEWDGDTPIYSEVADEYCYSHDDVESLAKACECPASELRLLLCEPVYARQLDMEHFVDALPEDGDPPEWLVDAIDAFNETIKGQPPLSWMPGDKAVVILEGD